MTTQTVGQIGEAGVLDLIRPYLHKAGEQVLVSMGDDCAVISGSADYPLQVLTTDLLVEGTHFLRTALTDWTALGRRSVVANISDLAAMGAIPDSILCSIGLPPDLPTGDLQQLYAGLREECDRWKARLVGGDTVRAPQLLISITAAGRKSATDAACLRSSCKPGQHVYVSGALGGCRAGLELQLGQTDQAADADLAASLIARQQVPEPRVQLGRYLATHYSDVAIVDISDGLYNELYLLAAASSVGMHINLPAIPLYPGVEEFARTSARDASQFALFSGEEYELLFCCEAGPEELVRGLADAGVSTKITSIGSVTAGSDVLFYNAAGAPVPLTDETFRHLTDTRTTP